MKRLFVLLAALAAVSVVVTGSAFAGAPGTTTCGGPLADPGQISGTVEGNLNVPAGTWCNVGWPAVIKGNAIVNGHLKSFGGTFNQNVTIDGGSFLALNGGTTILKNLSITNSAGDPDPSTFNGNGLFGAQYGNYIGGNFNYNGNSAPLYVGNPGEPNTVVGKNFTSSANTSSVSVPSLQVTGQTNIS
jgi:hypothetical protein